MYEEDQDQDYDYDFEEDEYVNNTVSPDEDGDGDMDDDIVNGNNMHDDDIVCNHNDLTNDIQNSDQVTQRPEDISFGANGWECTCSGSCLCRYYKPKGTYITDCMFCGHPLGWHKNR